MKKAVFILIPLVILCLLTSCSGNLTDKNSVINMYSTHESEFTDAAKTANFSDLKKTSGVQKVIVWEEYTDIRCGGSGFGPSTHYYGVFYSETDNLTAVDVSGPLDELEADGKGYRYKQRDGDNEYYVEPLGNHYFYYEAHF